MYGHGIGRVQLVVCLCQPNDVQLCREAVHLLMKGDIVRLEVLLAMACGLVDFTLLLKAGLGVRVEVMPVGDCIWRVQVS